MAIVLTGPQAIITVTDGLGILHTIGRARNIQVNSEYQRDWVRGIGQVGPSESPLLAWQGTVSVESYALLSKYAILNAFDMTVQDNEKFYNYLLFEAGIDMLVTAKRKDASGTIQEYPVYSLNGMFITSESWTIQENALSGRNGQFNLINPPRILASQLPGEPITEDEV